MRIRNVVPGDEIALLDLAQRCPPLDVHTAYTYWVLCNAFQEWSQVAEEGRHIVGMLTSVFNGSDLLIWQIGVDADWRGNGVASAMLEALREKSTSRGVYEARVTIDTRNEASIRAFSRFGLQRIGSLSLPGEEEDIYRLRLHPQRIEP